MERTHEYAPAAFFSTFETNMPGSSAKAKESPFQKCAKEHSALRTKTGLDKITSSNKMTDAEIANLVSYLKEINLEFRALIEYDNLSKIHDDLLCRFLRPSELLRINAEYNNEIFTIYKATATLRAVGAVGGGRMAGGSKGWAGIEKNLVWADDTNSMVGSKSRYQSNEKSTSKSPDPKPRTAWSFFGQVVGEEGNDFHRLTMESKVLYIWLTMGKSKDTRVLEVYSDSKEGALQGIKNVIDDIKERVPEIEVDDVRVIAKKYGGGSKSAASGPSPVPKLVSGSKSKSAASKSKRSSKATK